MGLRDHSVLTFDVVGTSIDFETGITDAVAAITHGVGSALDRSAVLAAFADAEDRQQQRTPEQPFTQMLEPIYRSMAGELGLPVGNGPRSGTADLDPALLRPWVLGEALPDLLLIGWLDHVEPLAMIADGATNQDG